jgi:hypothetical protein
VSPVRLIWLAELFPVTAGQGVGFGVLSRAVRPRWARFSGEGDGARHAFRRNMGSKGAVAFLAGVRAKTDPMGSPGTLDLAMC